MRRVDSKGAVVVSADQAHTAAVTCVDSFFLSVFFEINNKINL